MTLSTSVATEADVAEILGLRTRAAERLTRDFGRGHWSSCPTEGGVLRAIKTSRVLMARRTSRKAGGLLGTLRLATKKPWAIDVAYFTPVGKALYLLDMAVEPESQRQGVGRLLVEAAMVVAREWPAQAIRLDAYDAAAGAAPFYLKCGFSEVGRVAYRGVPLVYCERLLSKREGAELGGPTS